MKTKNKDKLNIEKSENISQNISIIEENTQKDFLKDIHIKDPYDDRKLDQQYVHGYNNQDIIKYLHCLDFSDGETVLDIGCGEGKIGFSSVEINPTLKLISMDFSPTQLKQAEKNFKGIVSDQGNNKPEFKLGSLTNTGLEDNSIDKVIAKMVLHEIPKSSQVVAMKEMYRILKPGGKIAIRCVNLNKKNQAGFQKIAREKDSLAGFDNLVKNRYFFTGEELLGYTDEAGFSKIEDNGTIKFIFDPNKFLDTDFKGDIQKLEKLKEEMTKILNQHKALKNAEVDSGNLDIGFKIFILTK